MLFCKGVKRSYSRKLLVFSRSFSSFSSFSSLVPDARLQPKSSTLLLLQNLIFSASIPTSSYYSGVSVVVYTTTMPSLCVLRMFDSYSSFLTTSYCSKNLDSSVVCSKTKMKMPSKIPSPIKTKFFSSTFASFMS